MACSCAYRHLLHSYMKQSMSRIRDVRLMGSYRLGSQAMLCISQAQELRCGFLPESQRNDHDTSSQTLTLQHSSCTIAKHHPMVFQAATPAVTMTE